MKIKYQRLAEQWHRYAQLLLSRYKVTDHVH